MLERHIAALGLVIAVHGGIARAQGEAQRPPQNVGPRENIAEVGDASFASRSSGTPGLPPEALKLRAAPILGTLPKGYAHPKAKSGADEQKIDPAKARATSPESESSESDTEKLSESDKERVASERSDQLDKFQQVFNQATKIFGGEHTVISPLFYYSGDISGRLQTTGKYQAGVSATLLLPLFGAGGGHGADWWPVVTSEDKSKIYDGFLRELEQYRKVVATVQSTDWKGPLELKLDAHALAVAKQLLCQEEIDIGVNKDEIARFCRPEGDAEAAVTAQEAVTKKLSGDLGVLVPKRHRLLLGPALAIPLTENPLNIFQYGAAVEVGGDDFRIIATGGMVGRYDRSSEDYKGVFFAGWYVGLALSGEIGDRLFHFFNGGSELMAQLAKAKSDPK